MSLRATITHSARCAVTGSLLILGMSAHDIAAQQAAVRFVSVPDFINMDLQFEDPRLFDLTAARQASLVARIAAGGPQATINPNVGNFIGTVENGYRGASQVLLEALATENASFFTVSGDMLYTRWPKSSQLSQPTAAQHIITQGDIYYDGWIDSVRVHSGYDYAAGEVFTIVGDHEVGDNNWPAAKRALLPTYRQAYVNKLGNPDTVGNGAYVVAPAGFSGRTFAVQRGNLLLLGIDQFATLANNTGPIDVTGTQLTWLDTTLAQARTDPSIDHIVVLGHAPIAKQASVRIGLSSGLMNDTGEAGPLWQTFVRHGVDLYLPGEVHAISMQEAEGALQVVTGTNIFQETGSGSFNSSIPFDINNPVTSEQNYMVVDSYPDRIELTIKQIETKIWGFRGTGNDPLNDEPYKDREARVATATAQAGFQTVGTMTIDKSSGGTVYTNRTGVFITEWPNPPVFAAGDGSIPLDMGTGFSPVEAGYNNINGSGNAGGVVDVQFSTNVSSGVDTRDRGALAPGQAQTDLARDFVFGVRSRGANYLDITFGRLTSQRYRFEGVFHDALPSAETDPIDIDVDTGSGFVQGAQANMTIGPNPSALGSAAFSFDVNGFGDVVVRIANLDVDGPHLITGLRLVPTTTTPASATPVLTSCVGPAGPLTLTLNSLPWTGTTYRATATGFAPGALGASVLGLGPQNLPLSQLHPAGLPNCELLATPDSVSLVLPAFGAVVHQLAVPNRPVLAGMPLWHQFVQLQPSTLSSSNGLALVIGVF